MPELTTIAIVVAILYLAFGIVTKATKWVFRIALGIIIFSVIIKSYDFIGNGFTFDTVEAPEIPLEPIEEVTESPEVILEDLPVLPGEVPPDETEVL